MSDQTAIAAGAQIIVSLGDKSLGYKIDLVTCILTAVRDAHRDVMTPSQWHELNGALAHLGAATIGGVGQPVGRTPICTRWHHHQAALKPVEGGDQRALPGSQSVLEAWVAANPPSPRLTR